MSVSYRGYAYFISLSVSGPYRRLRSSGAGLGVERCREHLHGADEIELLDRRHHQHDNTSRLTHE
jgi:hypothetical protein